MAPETLIDRLARHYWDDVNRYVPLVLHCRSDLEPCLDAAPRPIGDFIVAQGEADPDHFVLPEPLLGPVDGANLAVLVVGGHPGYSADADGATRLGTINLQRYIELYQDRFSVRDGDGRIALVRRGRSERVPHYNWIEESLLAEALGPRAFGKSAAFADAIPWRYPARPRHRPNGPDVAEYARDRVQDILEELRPAVVLTLGSTAAATLGGEPASWPGDAPAARAAELGSWRGRHVAALQPRSPSLWSRGARDDYARAVSRALAQAVGK